MQYSISKMYYRHLYLHPLMHIITYENGKSRNNNIKSKMAIRLKYSFVWQNSCMFLGSPDPDLEILLEVNLNFQVRLTIILAFGIFPRGNGSGSFLLKYNYSSPFLLAISVPLGK